MVYLECSIIGTYRLNAHVTTKIRGRHVYIGNCNINMTYRLDHSSQ